ncbi:serine protease [Sorangium sp. So ce1036]|uniref:serine protease n=1 Tax=Sorangium sp. So ce1036 TaxID=3133328 RepID=UPI003F04DA31
MSTSGKLLLGACLSLSASAGLAGLAGVAGLAGLTGLAAGCGGQQAPAPAAAPAPQAPRPAPPKPVAPPGQLARADVERVLLQGPPWILRRVPVEEVIRAGAFIGWKILALPPDWTDIELKPGDVVMQVNGASLERPDDLFAAYRNVASANELKIAYEREGSARELVLPIFGPPSKDVVAAFESDAPPPRRSTATRPRRTLVIEEQDSSTTLQGGAP